MEDRMTLAEQERADLVALLEELSPAEWEHPTLCAQWRVRDVVAHVFSYEELSRRNTAAAFVRGRFDGPRVNAIVMQRYAGATSDELLALARRSLRPRGLTKGFRGAIALVDGMIHQQDIRRPLGRPREVPADRMLSVLEFAKTAPTVHARQHRRGVVLRATDVDWTVGSGPEVLGTGEALLLAMAGRTETLDELSGDGLPLLRSRLA
jgi:uncharacterized protein (TIGR03083 family)